MYLNFRGRSKPEIVYCDDGFFVRVFDYSWFGLFRVAKLYVKDSWMCFIHPQSKSIAQQCLHETLSSADDSYIKCLEQLNERHDCSLYVDRLRKI